MHSGGAGRRRVRGTAVRLVYNPFIQFGPLLELYSQLQLSLWRDPISWGVPNSRKGVLVMIQDAGIPTETKMNK